MSLAEILLLVAALYPVITAAVWSAGGALFALTDERHAGATPAGGWPAVSVLIPAYNEEKVIATSVRAALAADYPHMELLVLDDGSADDTSAAARKAASGDPRATVVRDDVNRGKADRLNIGFRLARHELVIVTDADTHMHPQALRFLVARMASSPKLAAVAGAPHVTNRTTLLSAMQVLEAMAIIGLIRRAQALTGRVGVVAGVLGIFRRDAVLDVGGYDARMATEDIDLTWRLLLAGWHTGYEPEALVGMQVPSRLSPLWKQRRRWARGQGEVLHLHGREALRWRNRRMWVLPLESVLSLGWIILLFTSWALLALSLATGSFSDFGFGLAWGIAICVVATTQTFTALLIEDNYDHRLWRAFLLGPLYPLAYWMISGAAALTEETVAVVRGPRDRRVVWDIPREELSDP